MPYIAVPCRCMHTIRKCAYCSYLSTHTMSDAWIRTPCCMRFLSNKGMRERPGSRRRASANSAQNQRSSLLSVGARARSVRISKVRLADSFFKCLFSLATTLIRHLDSLNEWPMHEWQNCLLFLCQILWGIASLQGHVSNLSIQQLYVMIIPVFTLAFSPSLDLWALVPEESNLHLLLPFSWPACRTMYRQNNLVGRKLAESASCAVMTLQKGPLVHRRWSYPDGLLLYMFLFFPVDFLTCCFVCDSQPGWLQQKRARHAQSRITLGQKETICPTTDHADGISTSVASENLQNLWVDVTSLAFGNSLWPGQTVKMARWVWVWEPGWIPMQHTEFPQHTGWGSSHLWLVGARRDTELGADNSRLIWVAPSDS